MKDAGQARLLLQEKGEFCYLCKVLVGPGTPYLEPCNPEPDSSHDDGTVIARAFAGAASITL